MNKRLLNKSDDPESFKKTWAAIRPSLEHLEELLSDFVKELDSVTSNDFDCPNHYAKLAYKMGQAEAYKKVIELLK